MPTGAQSWSTTAAANNSADANVNWSEGQAPSSVNNSARAEMASAAMFIKDNSGSLLTTGSTAAYTVSSKQVSTALVDGYTIAVNFHATNDAAATLNVDSLGAKQLQLVSDTNLAGGEYKAGTSHRFRYSSSSTAWVEVSGTNLSSNLIPAASIDYSKIQNVGASSLLGNPTGSGAAVSEISLGTGLNFSGTSLTAPATPVAGGFKNLSIKVASSTTVTGAADFATLATSGSTAFITVPLTGTVNMASTGVVNGLDTGALANTTKYAIWGIAATSTSSAGGFLASTSFTTPLMPSGYAYKARLGAVVTTTTTATAGLYGTWQFGRRAQYVNGLAGTSKMPNMDSGARGNIATPTWQAVDTSNFVPTTASEIIYTVYSAGVAITAPSTSYGPQTSTTNPPVAQADVSAVQVTAILESTNVYWANNNASSVLAVLGWIDNI